MTQKLLIYGCIWLGLWVLFAYLEFGAVYFAVSSLVIIFNNLGQKKEGDISAYSVFNKDGRKIAGTMDISQFESEIRHQPHLSTSNSSMTNTPASSALESRSHLDEDQLSIAQSLITENANLSKLANQACPCGSGRKTKKCCGSAEALREAELQLEAQRRAAAAASEKKRRH